MEIKGKASITKQESFKILMKKKKELQRQLTTINQSLQSLMKKNDTTSKLEDTVRSKRKLQSGKSKKSFARPNKKY